jgi:hypothetical protein
MTATRGVALTRVALTRARTARWQAPTVLAAVALVALVGCGPGQPARIALPAGTSAGNLGFAASRSAELWVEPLEFSLADGVDVAGSQAPAWRYPAPGNADVTDLAARLGIDGTPEVLASADGGGWELAGGEGDPALFVSPGGTWWAGSGPTVSSSIPMAECDPDTPVTARPAPDSDDMTVIDGSAGCGDVTNPPVPAPELPGDEEILDAASAIFGASATVEIEWRDDWYVSVRADYLIDGEPSGHVGHYGVGARGWNASGQLGTPVEEGPYRTLSAADALVRLDGAFPGAPKAELPMSDGPMAESPMSAPDTAPQPGGAGPGTAEPGGEVALPGAVPGDPGDPAPPGPAPLGPGPLEPGPLEPGQLEPEPVEIVLVGVTTRLVPFVDGNGTVWSLPGYNYTAGDDNTWEVVAVAPEYFNEPAATPDDGAVPTGGGDSSDPGVVDPGTGGDSGGGDPGGGDVLPNPGPPPPPVEGLREEAATAALNDAGFEVRVVERDGEQFQMTMDYRDNRVNLAITNGVVTSATIG